MGGGVLLVVNCALDASYANRHVLRDMYEGMFDEVAFAVSPTCSIDDEFNNIVQSWDPSQLQNSCPCGTPALGEHSTSIHSFHPRLVDVQPIARPYEFLVFSEDDCVVSPRLDATRIREKCGRYDAYMNELEYCGRDNTRWIWTQHETGYPSFDAVAAQFDRERLLGNFRAHRAVAALRDVGTPMFYGFVDFFVLRTQLLGKVIADLQKLQSTWHEAAIPTAVLHHTSRIGVSNGLSLWGDDRLQTLPKLMDWLRLHDFLHPIKLSQYAPAELLDAYRAV